LSAPTLWPAPSAFQTVAATSVYANLDSNDQTRMVIVTINKTSDAVAAAINIRVEKSASVSPRHLLVAVVGGHSCIQLSGGCHESNRIPARLATEAPPLKLPYPITIVVGFEL
jgi:hypothetical protein